MTFGNVRLLIVTFEMSAALGFAGQSDPSRFANTVVQTCGRTGEVKSLASGSGTSGQVTTLYQRASFDVACENEQTGSLDVQLANNRPAVVSYRLANAEAQPTPLRGSNPDDLVDQAIRALCSCAAGR